MVTVTHNAVITLLRHLCPPAPVKNGDAVEWQTFGVLGVRAWPHVCAAEVLPPLDLVIVNT
jgi:hypothetical protein